MKLNNKYLKRDDWDKDVKKAISDLIDTYGINSFHYEKTPYVIFDFDNTTSIFDVEEQLIIYQLETMAFNLNPEELLNVLKTGLTDLNKDLSNFGYGKGSYNDWLNDIIKAYKTLYQEFGPFSFKGLDKTKQKEIQSLPEWKEFVTKMRALYNLVYDKEGPLVADPWILYWFTNMSEEEVYSLARSSHSYFNKQSAKLITWTSPKEINSKVGVVSYTWSNGICVTKNMKELWKALKENGIDIWVCSASGIDVIRAAIDEFNLHDYCKGLIAMTNKLKDGKYINAYNFESGCAYYAKENGKWIKGIVPTKSKTQCEGKVVSINNVLLKEYGHGPIAGFMDSSGDFNFCTEYKSLKLVVCINRPTLKSTDGGSLIARIAVFQRNKLGYDLNNANKNDDTYYVLQGRDESNVMSFRNSSQTISMGLDKERLFLDEENDVIYNYMLNNKMCTKDIINKFAIKTNDKELGITYGFLDSFSGYHSK